MLPVTNFIDVLSHYGRTVTVEARNNHEYLTRDVTLIFPIFPRSYHDFANFYRAFLAVLPMTRSR